MAYPQHLVIRIVIRNGNWNESHLIGKSEEAHAKREKVKDNIQKDPERKMRHRKSPHPVAQGRDLVVKKSAVCAPTPVGGCAEQPGAAMHGAPVGGAPAKPYPCCCSGRKSSQIRTEIIKEASTA